MAGTIKLWGRKSSANVQKAIWALKERDVEFHRVDVGGKFAGLDTPEFVAMNPNQRVPVLQNGDLTIWESHAILRYISATYGVGTLWPEDPGERAIVDQWTDWTATTFQPAWLGLFWKHERTPPSKRDAKIIGRYLELASDAFRLLDAQLEKSPFLVGKTLTYADIAAGVSLYRWTNMEIRRPSLPNVEAWYKRLRERPAFVESVCVSFDDLVGREVF